MLDRLRHLSEILNSTADEPPDEWKPILEPLIKKHGGGESFDLKAAIKLLSNWLQVSPLEWISLGKPRLCLNITNSADTILSIFELDYTEGEIRYKTSLDAEVSDLIRTLIYTSRRDNEPILLWSPLCTRAKRHPLCKLFASLSRANLFRRSPSYATLTCKDVHNVSERVLPNQCTPTALILYVARER